MNFDTLILASREVTGENLLERYRFEVGKEGIVTLYNGCQKRTRITEQQFRRSRILLGDPGICAFCYRGDVAVCGVTAVRRE